MNSIWDHLTWPCADCTHNAFRQETAQETETEINKGLLQLALVLALLHERCPLG